ncbi:ABC-type nitrate/sulfonate/bicarbonate transport systems, periplasmic components [Rhodovastum atsumiense]|uniref:ABC transporter substrate-binding protein n=1 Tax=Rhodovastum atsumiense TaxID=504468 RepID=A0A5M6INM9_9PROT|nr:ABC transporter substrate-binding protein [Rhodovastum atsumiense]KAA5609876.1 ABC transporter substrate-binding protein [Rhodovastum atsumiense]CAH2602423.1 ABC-type nitrate/sulfonate/bicarbonate transport systems, periplasmic components [Rhodovastum atsumiense]
MTGISPGSDSRIPFTGRRALLRGAAGLLPVLVPAAPALAAPALVTKREKITFVWFQAALCLVAIGVAQREGLFERNGLEVEFLQAGGDIAPILEALAMGKADATSHFLLRFMKPLEAGFDARLTAGLHAGCFFLVASREAGIGTLQDLRGKRIGMADLGSPMKMLFEIHLQRNGVPLDSITWRQFPSDVFAIAAEKGEIDAFADVDPNAYYAVRRSRGKLFVLAANGSGELANHACCGLLLSGRLIRERRPVAAALTRALTEAALLVGRDNPAAVASAQQFSPKQAKPEELGEMIAGYPHTEQLAVTGAALRRHVLYHAQGLKETGVLKPGTDPARFTERVTVDVLAG